MAVQMQPSFILTEKFEKLKFTDFVSVDSVSTPSTPSTPCSPPTDPYEIDFVRTEDREEVLQFLRTFFIRDEPLNYTLGFGDNCKELEEFCLKGYDNGVSLKAVCNGKIVGLCFNGTLERGYIDNMEECQCSDTKFIKILRLLDHVAVQSDIFSHYPDVDKAMTVKVLSVDRSWRGRGIAKELMNKTRDLAREQGCGIMTADCTSHFTAKALKKLGFECIYSLKYADYKVDGEVVFTPEEPHVAVTVYSQRIA